MQPARPCRHESDFHARPPITSKASFLPNHISVGSSRWTPTPGGRTADPPDVFHGDCLAVDVNLAVLASLRIEAQRPRPQRLSQLRDACRMALGDGEANQRLPIGVSEQHGNDPSQADDRAVYPVRGVQALDGLSPLTYRDGRKPDPPTAEAGYQKRQGAGGDSPRRHRSPSLTGVVEHRSWQATAEHRLRFGARLIVAASA
jgi:hypothetical protein